MSGFLVEKNDRGERAGLTRDERAELAELGEENARFTEGTRRAHTGDRPPSGTADRGVPESICYGCDRGPVAAVWTIPSASLVPTSVRTYTRWRQSPCSVSMPNTQSRRRVWLKPCMTVVSVGG